MSVCYRKESQQKIPQITLHWRSWLWVKSLWGLPGFLGKSQFYGSLILVFGARQSLLFPFFDFSRFPSGLCIRDFQVLCKAPLAPPLPWVLVAGGGKQHARSCGNKARRIFHFPHISEKWSGFVYRWCCVSLEKELRFPMALWSLGGVGADLGLCKRVRFGASLFRGSKT